MTNLQNLALWVVIGAAVLGAVAASLMSPLLAWRDPIYILAGLAGVISLGLLLVQPVLITVAAPRVSRLGARRVHRWVGTGVVVAVLVHVGALWITSPPDVVDVLLLRSPTPFSIWGVMAMWAVFAVGGLVVLRRRFRPRLWRQTHVILVAIIAVCSVAHTLLIEGTMEPISKTILCILVLVAAGYAIAKVWRRTF